MKRLIVILAALLMLGGVAGCAGKQVKAEPKGEPMKCMTLENRTNIEMLMALSPVPGEFFYGEKFEPLQTKQVCYDWTPGSYMFCWMSQKMMQPSCLQFELTEEDINRTLYDYDVDIWVEPSNKQSS